MEYKLRYNEDELVLEIATEAASGDASGYRYEFLNMVKRAKQISGR